MKNEEKKEKKPFQNQKLNKENKKPTRKSTNQIEKYNKNMKNMTNIKNNMSNIYKITTGTTLFSDNNKKEKNDAENSFEGKMFYEVNNLNKNSYNFNSPIKTINVYRNNFFNYTNNNILSNLLCDVSDDNKNVMVSELDLNISNSQAPTPRPENIQPPQKRLLEKQNTEIDFKSQLESNIIKILEKNLANNNDINNKIKTDKKPINQIITEENKDINVINLNKLNINKEENDNKIKNNNNNNENKNKIKQNDSNKYISKVNSREIKNKYFVSSAKSRKTRGLKSPNINIHKVNSIISPSHKTNGNKKIYINNYTKTDICLKKYKTIIENNNNTNNNKNNNKNNQINSVKFYNQIKSKTKKNKIQTHNTTSKKAIKSYIIYNHNLANNKISYPNNNYRHFIYKLNEKSKSKNILLTNNSNNNLDTNVNSNSIHQIEKMNYSKYKNLLNELQKNLSKHLKKEENISKANSHRNKKNQTYLIFNLENNNGRKSIKKGEIFSSNTCNTISNKYNLNSQKNINDINKNGDLNDNDNNDNNGNKDKNIIMMNHSIIHNSDKLITNKNITCLTKQNSENNLLHNNDKDPKTFFYEKKRSNKNNSCQLNQKLEGILSDSFLSIKNKLSCEKNKYKYNNNLSLYGVEKINIEINQKSNNSNIEINPKDLLEATNKEKDKQKNYSNKTLNNSQIKKKNSDVISDKNIINKKSKKKNIINKKMNASNNKYKFNNTNSKSNNINNMVNNNNMITFRNKFINNISIKKHLSNSKDNKEKENREKQKYKKLNNKVSNKNYYYNNNINLNYNHFSPINRIKEKSNKKIIKEGNKINIDINFNNNINYIYIIKTKKSRFKNKSNNHFCTMK